MEDARAITTLPDEILFRALTLTRLVCSHLPAGLAGHNRDTHICAHAVLTSFPALAAAIAVADDAYGLESTNITIGSNQTVPSPYKKIITTS